MNETAEIIAVIRDIAIISTLFMVVVIVIVTFRKMSATLDSAKRAMAGIEDIVTALSSRIVGPASAGSGLAFGAGKLAAFIFGLSKKKGTETDGQQ